MSENAEAQQAERDGEGDPAVDIGAVLADAREHLGLSIEEAAQQLRLSPRQLHAMEANDHGGLPGATFVRGFIRNYARLLQLDPGPLLHAYGLHTPESGQQSISLRSEGIPIIGRGQKFWLPYVIASVLVGVALGGWMIYMDYSEHEVSGQIASVPEPVLAKSTVPVMLPAVKVGTPAPEQPPVPPVPSNVVAEISAPVAVNLPAELSIAGGSRLKLSFSQQSWVSVIDRSGKEVFNKTKPAGSEDVAGGLPPFKITVGNAAGVQMTFNDKPVDIAPYTKANVARFTLE